MMVVSHRIIVKHCEMKILPSKPTMKDEMDSLLGNQTWELIELPAKKKALHNNFLYQLKTEHDSARIILKGF